jgi:CHASE2 domain-containing sensor protein
MREPTAEESAAIAVAYLALQREQTPPATPVSRWRLAARALPPDAPQRAPWRGADRVR